MVLRVALGVIFLMSGALKLVVPPLREAWSEQLTAAAIPLHEVNFQLVPLVEIVVGGLLLLGRHTRLAALLIVPMMLVAIYVHVVADDPSLFPLQPHAPVVPSIVLVLALYVWFKEGARPG